MRTRIAAATIAAAALLALTACSSSSNDDKTASTPSSTRSTAPTAPAGPDAAQQALLLAALKAVDPGLAADQDKSIADSTAQCAVLATSGDPSGHTAAQRFSTPAQPLTDAQGAAINQALQLSLCPPS